MALSFSIIKEIYVFLQFKEKYKKKNIHNKDAKIKPYP